jgi:hypothetical protein
MIAAGDRKQRRDKNIKGATTLRLLRPLQLCRQVFEASRLNLCVKINPPVFPGKRNLKIQLWKAVHDCAKVLRLGKQALTESK